MNWVEEARKQAELHSQAELEKEKQKRRSMQEAAQNALEEFHRVIDDTKAEIEQILEEARGQGLSVSVSHEGYQEDGPGNFRKHIKGETDGQGGWCATYVYVVYWIVTEPINENSLTIMLGAETTSAEEKDFWGKITIKKTSLPTVTAPSVKKWIKSWLVEMFST